ncbi:patatin-like phospholipase family protein [Bradyrhizobium sp. STM 3557]|uniref:patatin-like phospholipase family protein n=1 Tax=Bradyrhizobium sp. STM 3557 TaxID=578920 RepID=UPI003890A23B
MQRQAAPRCSNATALLSAAQIWSTGDSTSPAPIAAAAVVEPAPAVEAPRPNDVVAEAPKVASQPAVTELILAATGMKPVAELRPTVTEVKLPATGERSLAQTIAATPALTPAPRIWPPRKLSLALQGGGTFSAFSWGVIERLLEEPGVDFDTISGASAGAINAALLVCGLADGGREAARKLLARFWNSMTSEASFRSLLLVGGFSPASSEISVGSGIRASRFDPFDLAPLQEMLTGTINFAAVQDRAAPRLLIAATRVRDGGQRIFRNAEITANILLASTCPPQLQSPIRIDGEAYWDGGFAANPPIVSLVHESSAADLLVVQVTPTRDDAIPDSPAAIDGRLDQITANAVLNAELAALEWARSDGLHPPRVHRLAAEDAVEGLAEQSATDFGATFIAMLHQRGREAADCWLREAPSGTTLAPQERRAEFDAAILDSLLV